MFEFSIISTVPLLLAESGSDAWWNYPGLELWKFVNLIVFAGAGFLLHWRFGQPIRQALRSRRDTIQRELLEARKERDQALAKLAEVELRLGSMETDLQKVGEKARAEAEAEKRRMMDATEQEIARIRDQARKDIERAGKTARYDLRQFAVAESMRYAEAILQSEIGREDDLRLTERNVEELGRTGF